QEDQVVPLQAVEPKRLYRQIADQIAQLIASGEFPAGSRLPAERELAVSLGVSRTSVREAIISLEMSRLVEVRVGTGIFVTAQNAAAHRASADSGPGPFELLDASPHHPRRARIPTRHRRRGANGAGEAGRDQSRRNRCAGTSAQSPRMKLYSAEPERRMICGCL